MANREFGGKIRSKRSHNLQKPYDRRSKSFLNKFTETVKDILVPSWLSDFLKGKSSAENTNNVEEQNGNEEENEENDTYLTPQDSPAVGERRPAQPRPLHPEFSSYHQQQTKSISRRPNLPNFGNEHLLPSHKVQYPPDPRFSTPTNSSLANDVLAPIAENSEAFLSPMLEKRTYLHLSEAEVDQLRNRLHPTNDTNATTSTHLQQQATDDNELDDEEASVSVEPEDAADLDRSEAWNSSYLRANTNSRGPRGKRPSFEPSLFGSPFMKSSLLSDSLHESPFYSGKTRYGGAAANRKLRLKMSNPYSTATPYRKQVNAKPIKSSSSAVTSSTAKRILDTLEMMATPLSDAHRIPIANNSFTDSVLQFTPSSLKRRQRPTVAASMFSPNSQKVPSRGPPSVMSNTPSIAKIARNRQPLQRSFHIEPKKLPEKTNAVESPVEQEIINKPIEKLIEEAVPKTRTPEPIVREPTPEPVAREPTPEVIPPFEPAPASKLPVAAPSETIIESPSTFGSSTGGKMKRDKSYSLRPGARGHDEEEEPPVELETNFILPVKEMPKFAFGANLATPKSSETPPPPQARPPLHASGITSTPAATSAAPPSPELFTFSSPILNKAPAAPQSSTSSSLDFKFSSPAQVEEQENPMQTFQFSSPAASTFPKPKFSSPLSTGVSVAPQLKSGSVLEALGGKTNSPPSVSSDNNFSSGFLTAKTLKTSGSVMDILGGAKKSSPAPFSSSGSVFGGMQPAATLKTGSVMDILGKTTEEKTPTVTTTSTNEPDPFMAKFAKPAGSWDCDVCMIQNKPEATKCVACETSKPAPAPPKASSSAISKPDDLMSKFLKPTGAWECDTCMLQNKAESLKCCACETPKPGQAAPLSAAAAAVSQKVDPLMAKFLKPIGTWECGVCMIQNKSSDRACVACQTANPDAPPAPAGTGSADVLPKFGAGVVSSSGFKFGSQSDSSASTTTSTGGFKFGSTTTTSESTGFKFGATSSSTTSAPSTETASNGFVFGQPAAAAATDKKESSENSGFKFGSSSVPTTSTSAAPFSFGSETNTKPSAEEEKTTTTTTESGFSFSQPSTTGFPFGAPKDKTTESSAPLFGTCEVPLATGPTPFGSITNAPAVDAEASKPSAILPAATTPSQGFPFGTATSTTGSLFKTTEPSLAPATPFAPWPDTSAPAAAKPLFGAEVPARQSFAFGASAEPIKSPGLSESKPAFGSTSLKRDRDVECDGPSDAKRSFGSSAPPATTPASFGGFNFAGPGAVFSAASSNQFPFGAATNSASPFGGGNVTTASASTTTTAASGFGAPSINFAGSSPAATPATTNTTQPFLFGGKPNSFGSKSPMFGSTGSPSSSLFDKSAASKPFGAPPTGAPPSTAASKPFGATPAAAPQPAANSTFVFGNRTPSSFNFNAGAAQPGLYQLPGKAAEPPAASTNNYQFGQTPITNNAPLGANPSSATFNITPNFSFAAGTGGDFTFGATNESTSSNPTTASRKIKKAVRRSRHV